MGLIPRFGLLLSLGCVPVFGQSKNPFLGSRPAAQEGAAVAPAGADGVALVVSQAEAAAARLAEARVRLAAAEAESADGDPAGARPGEVLARRTGLGRLVRLHEQHMDNLAAIEKVRQSRIAAERAMSEWKGFAEPPPYTPLFTDRLREDIQANKRSIASSQASIRVLDDLIEESHRDLELAEERSRQLHEQLEAATTTELATRLAWRRDGEKVRSQLAAASVSVLETERVLASESEAYARARLSLLQRQVVIADAGVVFTQDELERIREQIAGRQRQLEGELAAAIQALPAARAAYEAAQAAAHDAGQGPAAALLLETVLTREAQWYSADASAGVLRMILEAASVEQAMWEMRHAAYDSDDVETLRDSRRRLEGFSHRFVLWREYVRRQSESAWARLQTAEVRWSEVSGDPELRRLADERLQALRERDRVLRRLDRTIERLDHLAGRWSEGLQAATSGLPIVGRAQNLFSDLRNVAARFWDFEVFAAEDTITVDGQEITGRRSVTVGKIVMAFLILVVGYWVTGVIAAFLEPIVVRRLGVEPNEAGLMRRWFRAFLVVCLVLFSLTSVKIPLTVFAFAGGALAIALGFGMQTLLKNFVSGIILLFERPFRVGDTLDVGGQRGTVSSIGLRASVLQLWDGTEALIPNSSLLENNVTNWTYTNRKVRFAVTVGVAYGTDPRRVIAVLAEVADRHGLVETDPKPMVLFSEFGESTLNFELRYWIDIVRCNGGQVSSDLRLMIAGAFAEQGIAIDYPQRDVHLHAAGPLPVRVMRDDGITNADPKPAAGVGESRDPR